MGIYYALLNHNTKEAIHPFKEESIKWPGIIHPKNSFARLCIFALWQEWQGDDVSFSPDFDDCFYEYEDITKKMIALWNETYPELDWFPKE